MTNFRLNAERAKVTQKAQKKNHLSCTFLLPLRNLRALCIQACLNPANLLTGVKV